MSNNEGIWRSVSKLGIYEEYVLNGRAVSIQLIHDEDEYSFMYLLSNGTWRRECEMLPTDLRVLFQEYMPRSIDSSIQQDWLLTATPVEELTSILRGNSNEPWEPEENDQSNL